MDSKRKQKLNWLEERIGYTFKDKQLVNMALTHTSYVKGDGRASEHNERLEFLGDAVLELCVSEYLYNRFSSYNEGDMTRLRAQTVCEGALFEVAKKLELGTLLLLGRGEDHSGGREKPSILSDAVEALIGALYIDGGMETAKAFIMGFIGVAVQEAVNTGSLKDYKTMLQEYIQKHHMGQIAYVLTGSSGPDHNKVFNMDVSVAGIVVGSGVGKTKQEAGQQAARAALEQKGVIEELTRFERKID